MKKEFFNTFKLLENYTSEYHEESITKAMMLDLLTNCDDCFLRSCRVGHFTASAFLLNKNMTHVCLMHHTKLNKWVQLGGHCDGDPDVLNVAIREAQEESGIKNIKPIIADIFDLDIHLIPHNTKEEAHYHFDIRFLLHAYDDDTLIKNHESQDLKWFEHIDIEVPTNITRMLKKWQKMKVNIN